MKRILLTFTSLIFFLNTHAQGFYSMKHAVDSVYANDNSEDGPRAKVDRMENRWRGQFDLNGTFTQAAQNFYDFSNSINPNSRINQSGSCGNFIPNWTEVGPIMDNNNASNYGHTGAGQMNRITFHPNYDGVSNKTVYALSRFGGLWVTYNDGDNWARINTDPYIPFSSLGVLVIDPVNPSRMYVTTGEPCGNEGFEGYHATNDYPYYTLGIYATDNGGQSWQKINNGIGTNTLLFITGSIYNMKMDPTNHDNLIFTSTDGIYICTNASGSLNSITWNKDNNFNSSFGSDNKTVGIAYNPTSAQWYISGLNIYTTSNPFGTHTWQLATGSSTGLDLTNNIYQSTGEAVQRINIISSPFYTNNIYALLYVGTNNMVVAKKTGTNPWQIIKYFYSGLRPQDKMALTVSPNNPNDVYIGSASYHVYDSSTDAVNSSYPYTTGFHPDIHYFFIHPSQPNKLWAATDGGISVKDLTVTGLLSGFTYKNNGIQSHLMWDLDDSELDKDYYISALQDNGIVFKGGLLGNTWGTSSNIVSSAVGDGYQSNIYDANPAEAYVAGNSGIINQFNYNTGSLTSISRHAITGKGSLNYFDDPAYPGDRILISDWNMVRSEDNGATYGNFGGYLGSSSGTINYNGVPANNPCGSEIFRTTHPLNYRQGIPFNVYAISRRLSEPLPRTGCPQAPYKRPSLILKSVSGYGKAIPGNEEFTNVAAITNALYDAALTAGAITNLSLPELSDISCHPYDGNKVWVSSSDLFPGLKVWKTTNGGASWTNADPNGAFSKIPVFAVLAAGGPNDLVFAGTQDGVYYTDNTMSGNWCRYGASPSIQVFSLKINPCKNVLLVQTYGRGAFEVNLPFMPNLVNIDQATSVTWNTPHHFPSSSLHVKSGTTLTIDNTTVDFGPNSRLYVEKGAKVIIQNNAVVTSASSCNGYMWLGIELQGDIAQKQIISSGVDANHGMCVIQSGGTVKNALVGVKNFATVNGDGESIDWAKMGGGILQSNGGKFINCKIGARFITYSNTNIINLPSKDLSVFYNTQFLTDATTATPRFKPEAHASMWNTRGINFNTCTFKNTSPTSYSIDERGLGIVSYDAGYDVASPCTTYGTNGCTAYGTPNTFENLYYGIDASASLPTASLRVFGNSFINNHRGMLVHGMDHAIANDNLFKVGDAYSKTFLPSTAVLVSAPCGIYLDGSDAYTMHRNTFTNATGTGNSLDFGLVDSYSNTNPNELRQNSFDNIAVGIQAQENNDGLQLKCNQFTTSTMNTADVKVMGLQTYGTIAAQQGYCDPDPTKLPGNKFSHTCSSAQDLSTNSYVSGQVTYNTRSTPSQELPQSGCYNTTNYVVNLCTGSGSGDACPANSPILGGGGSTPVQLQQNLKDSKTLVAKLQALLTKGNRSALFTVIGTGNQTAVIDSFNVTGPYLSDSVLIAFLKYKPMYTNGFIKQALIACSPLSSAVRTEFASTPVNGTTRDAVNAAQTGTASVRTSTELALKYEKKMLIINYDYLIANLVNDRDNDARLDTVTKYLDYTIKPASRAVMVGALLEKGLTTDALAQANAIENNPDLKSLLVNMISVRTATNPIAAYTGSTKTELDKLKDRVPYNMGVKAQALYNSLYKVPFNEKIYLSTAQQSLARMATQQPAENKPVLESGIRVFPNPATNEVYFLIDSEEEALQVQIELYDVQGRLMVKKVVEHTEEAHKLELTTFAEGVYFYKVSAGADYLKTGKIVVIK